MCPKSVNRTIVSITLAMLVVTVLTGAAQRGSARVTRHPVFRDLALQRGLDFTHTNGASAEKFFPEIMGSGGIFLDFASDAIEILARATPKRDYYCQSRRGNRLFELGLEEFALAFTAASSKSDQAMIERVLAEHGRDGFVTGWLAARGLGWAADLIPGLIKQEGLS